MTTQPTPARLTATDVVKLYRAGDAITRAEMRKLWPLMAVEFNAIERDEDHEWRKAEKQQVAQ